MMEGHREKFFERCCESKNERIDQFYKVSTSCHVFREQKEELETDEELLEVCSLMVRKCLLLMRIGRPDILWSVNYLARAFTKWCKACEKRLAKVDVIHSLREWIQKVLSRGKHNITMQNLGSLKVVTLRVTCRIQNRRQEEFCVFYGSHTFVPVGWSCKKPTAVSDSCTEAEVISLDGGLRLDGIPTGLWDIVIDVLEPQAQSDLMRHSKKKPQMSKNTGVKQ